MHDLQTIIAMNAERAPAPRRKPEADLKVWTISSFRAENVVAHGYIYNDQANRFQDGSEVRTSRVLSVDIANMRVETLNTIYNLKS